MMTRNEVNLAKSRLRAQKHRHEIQIRNIEGEMDKLYCMEADVGVMETSNEMAELILEFQKYSNSHVTIYSILLLLDKYYHYYDNPLPANYLHCQKRELSIKYQVDVEFDYYDVVSLALLEHLGDIQIQHLLLFKYNSYLNIRNIVKRIINKCSSRLYPASMHMDLSIDEAIKTLGTDYEESFFVYMLYRKKKVEIAMRDYTKEMGISLQ